MTGGLSEALSKLAKFLVKQGSVMSAVSLLGTYFNNCMSTWVDELEGFRRERLGTHERFENDENVCIIMGVHFLTRVAEINGTIGASEPFSLDTLYASITYR